MNKLVNFKTGEVIDLKKSTPTEITEALSLLIIRRKEIQAIEAKVKEHIKKLDLRYEENENLTLEARFGIARIRKTFRESFDKKKFEEMATQEEKEIFKQASDIENKYKKLTEIITMY